MGHMSTTKQVFPMPTSTRARSSLDGVLSAKDGRRCHGLFQPTLLFAYKHLPTQDHRRRGLHDSRYSGVGKSLLSCANHDAMRQARVVMLASSTPDQSHRLRQGSLFECTRHHHSSNLVSEHTRFKTSSPAH